MAVASTVFRRACALAVLVVAFAAGCGDDADQVTATGGATPTSSASETSEPASTDTTAPAPATPVDLEFRPVLQQLPPGGLPDAEGGAEAGCATPEEAWAADQPVVAPQVDNGEEVGCFELGPVRVDGAAVESAAAVEDPLGNWMVSLVLTNDGIATFNEIVASCFEGAPSCPSRQLAIVVDRTVLSAPSINAPEFERDQISISGSFTRDEAEALAAGLG